jgi:hypothetical protein
MSYRARVEDGVLAERGIWWQLQAGWKAFAIVVSYEIGNEAFWAAMEGKYRPMYGMQLNEDRAETRGSVRG